MKKQRCISVLGSTGSIGRQSLDVIARLGLSVAALTANRDVKRMEAQCRQVLPTLAVMMDETAAAELRLPEEALAALDRIGAAGTAVIQPATSSEGRAHRASLEGAFQIACEPWSPPLRPLTRHLGCERWVGRPFSGLTSHRLGAAQCKIDCRNMRVF